MINIKAKFREQLNNWQELTTKGKIQKIAKWSGIGAVIGVVMIIILFIAVWLGWFGKLPEQVELRQIYNPIASEVYSADGVLLGKYYLQNRTNVSYEEIPQHFIDALIATEDARFYEHGGVDFRSLLRVLFKSLLLQNKNSGGGSTISQQLAKNLYARKRVGMLSMPVNKMREMIIATRLESVYDKDDILLLYLNTVSFGEDVFGLEVASKRFFSADCQDLKLEESAVLVGMLQAPTSYNPHRNPERATVRRNTVFEQMVKYDYLEAERVDSFKNLEMKPRYKYVGHSDGLAPYFRESLRMELIEWCKNNKKPNGDHYNLYTDGLKIYTTLHSAMQKYAQQAVSEHLRDLQPVFNEHWKNKNLWDIEDATIKRAIKASRRYKVLKENGVTQDKIDANFKKPVTMRIFTHKGEVEKTLSPLDSIIYYQSFLHAGFVAMEPTTGYIRAYVGGIDHHYFQYDHVRSKRQVGSIFKPILYASALQNGYTPCDYISNEKVVYTSYDDWSPDNAGEDKEGEYSLTGGLTKSDNRIAAALIMNVGIDKVIDLAKEMGVKNEIPEYPSIALGAVDLSVMEMVGAYGTFASRGRYTTPTYLIQIKDKDGNTLEHFQKSKPYPKTVLTKDEADLMTQMMRSVVDSGTARRLRTVYGLNNQIAGKTGTTNNHADGWFMGYTPDLVAGAWVGGEDRRVRFRSLYWGQGAKMALPIWGKFMEKVYKHPDFRYYGFSEFPAYSMEVADMLDCPNFRAPGSEIEIPTIQGDLEETLQEFIKRQQEKSRARYRTKEERKAERKRRKEEKRKRRKKGNGFFKRLFEEG